jgi:hypothetical protein
MIKYLQRIEEEGKIGIEHAIAGVVEPLVEQGMNVTRLEYTLYKIIITYVCKGGRGEDKDHEYIGSDPD